MKETISSLNEILILEFYGSDFAGSRYLNGDLQLRSARSK